MKGIELIIASILLISSISLGISADLIQPAVSTVEIKSFSFQPNSITVPVGATVSWVNRDSVDHTVTSEEGTFNSGNIMSGGEFKFTFSRPGTYNYRCSIHPSMTGVVTVTTLDKQSNGQSAVAEPNTTQPAPTNATKAPASASKQPGFEVIFAITGLLGMGYLLSTRKP
jgi:plastocyanin